jgi:acetolactate synthase I/II/III large subunit
MGEATTNTIAEQVVAGIRAAGIDTLFCLPGVQNDDFFDVLFDTPEIRPIVTRHEQGAAYMANGYSLVGGKPGAFCVVPGPGMLNAGGALTSGYWSNARVLAVIGEIATSARGRGFGVLHELPDQHAILTQLTKHGEVLDDGATATEQIQVALDALVSGRPRPVSLEVPVDRWRTPAPGTIAAPRPTRPAIDVAVVERVAAVLATAERPLIVIGGGAQDAGDSIARLAELLQAPVTTRRMGHGAIPTAHPLFVHLAVGHTFWKTADVVVAIGTRAEWPLMHWGTDPSMTFIKVDIDEAELDRHRLAERGVPTIGVYGDAGDVCSALIEALAELGPRPDRTAEVARRRADYFAEIDHLRPQLDFLEAIRDVLPDDGVLVEDVTQIGFAAHLAFDFRGPRTFQSTGPAGTLGAGYAQGVGAQVALDAEGKGRKALVVAGDGGFMFTGNELATAVQHVIPLVCCVFDDGAFGNVKRIQQQRFGEDRTIVSTLRNPDFVAYARAFGALALHADGPDQLRGRLDEAFSANVPAIVHVSTGPMPDPWPWFLRGRAR